MKTLAAPWPLLDGRILTFDSAEASFFVLMFTENTLAVFDQHGSIPQDNLTTDPTFIDGAANWNTRLVGPSSQVTFAAHDTHLLPQQAVAQLVLNGDFSLGGIGWAVDADQNAEIIFSGGTCQLIGGTTAAQFARISQEITTQYPASQHTISALVAGTPGKLSIGTTLGATDIYSDANYDGTPAAFTPPSSPFYLQFESYGSGAITTLDDIVISQDTAGEAGISQQVTVVTASEAHLVRVSSNGQQEYRVRVGTSEGDGSYFDEYSSADNFRGRFTPIGDYWITVDAYGDLSDDVLITSIYSWHEVADDEIAFATPYLDSELRGLYFIPTPEANTAYVLHPNHPPYKVSRSPTLGLWSWQQVVFINPPSEWGVLDWPSVGTYYQGRLWLAANNSNKQTFWASQSGLPEDFTTNPTPVDSDSLEFTLANFGRIRWMIATKDLLVGTINGEYLVYAEGGVITPNDVQADQQSSYGSAQIQPLQIGDEVVYVSPDRRKAFATQYARDEDNWLSKDLTFISEHITKAELRSIAWAQHPDQLLWCVLEDGTACCLTYERAENIYGWHRHSTQGYIREFASGIVSGTSHLLALVQRKEGDLQLEVMDEDIYMDAYAQSTVSSTAQVFSGFDHLAGKIVQVLLDGAVHPDTQVASDGTITTQWPGHTCEAGLQYTPKVVTLPFDRGAPAPGGQSGQVYEKRYNKLQVTLLDSALPVINGELRPDRTPATPMDTREPNADGLSKTRQILLGWSQEATVTIEQPLPLACTVLAIGGEMAEKKL